MSAITYKRALLLCTLSLSLLGGCDTAVRFAIINVQKGSGPGCDEALPPLAMAIQAKDVSRVVTLLQSGASVNEPYDYCGSRSTHLGHAVRVGNLLVVKALLSAGADPLLTPSGNQPILHNFVFGPFLADKTTRLDLIRTLVAAGADMDAQGFRNDQYVGGTVLENFIAFDQPEEASILIQAGASMRAAYLFGALSHVKYKRNPDAWLKNAELMIQRRGLCINTRSADSSALYPRGRPEFLSALGFTESNVTFTKFFVKNGGDPELDGLAKYLDYLGCTECLSLLEKARQSNKSVACK